MNIFFLDKDPKIAARFHCNKHIISQLKESCQILSTTHRILDGTLVNNVVGKKIKNKFVMQDDVLDNLLYTDTHHNHPSVIWARQCDKNYLWLFQLYEHLITEYNFRYGVDANKEHKSSDPLLRIYLKNPPKNIKKSDVVIFPTKDYIVAGDSNPFDDPIEAYRNLYNTLKHDMCEWYKKENKQQVEIEKPYWFK